MGSFWSPPLGWTPPPPLSTPTPPDTWSGPWPNPVGFGWPFGLPAPSPTSPTPTPPASRLGPLDPFMSGFGFPGTFPGSDLLSTALGEDLGLLAGPGVYGPTAAASSDVAANQYYTGQERGYTDLASRGLLESGGAPTLSSALTSNLYGGLAGAEQKGQEAQAQYHDDLIRAISGLANAASGSIANQLGAKLGLAGSQQNLNLSQLGLLSNLFGNVLGSSSGGPGLFGTTGIGNFLGLGGSAGAGITDAFLPALGADIGAGDFGALLADALPFLFAA